MTLKEIVRISRPRFWLYEAATFALVGAVATNAPREKAATFSFKNVSK